MSREKKVSSRIKMRRKDMIHDRPTDICTRNHCKERRNGERMPELILVPGSHERLPSRKRVMCSRNMGAHVQGGIQSMKGKRNGIRNWCPAQPRKVQKTSK